MLGTDVSLWDSWIETIHVIWNSGLQRFTVVLHMRNVGNMNSEMSLHLCKPHLLKTMRFLKLQDAQWAHYDGVNYRIIPNEERENFMRELGLLVDETKLADEAAVNPD
jgi:hypothetical protein